ncbi:MAG: hypothetical protein KC478_01640 [Bacteriovoracaceae bacterium]|nr:hypothetical protein [Bacteriovoracaceae bacterium]
MDYKPMSGSFLKNRGRCCKSACLHCPYGFTLKRFGLDFKPALDAPDKAIELAKKELSNEELENFRLIYLKDSLAGVMRINHIQVKELFLHEDFQDQNLSIEIIESYYFY